MSRVDHVWVVDDDRTIRWVLERALKRANIEVTSFDCATDVMKALRQEAPSALISDIRMPGMDGLLLLERVKSEYPDLPVIIMTAHSDLDNAVSAYRSGAFEYLPKPFDVDEAVALARRACLLNRKQAPVAHAQALAPPEIVGEAAAMQEVFRAIGRLSRSNITVLINGASGTGKELVARALHRHSPRADKPFIALNTAAIPKDLLESELFGHERGAFTGAQALRRGRFEQADGGTLFLDEIGDMPADLQTRLLRVLSDGEFFRVGGYAAVKVDVRIIAATHQDLEQRVKKGLFREDLFHRLNVIRIHVPSLRERREDIPLLLDHFLLSAAKELETEPKILHKDVLDYLCSLDWPGNVRQLENICRWLTVMASGREVHIDDLPREMQRQSRIGQDSNWQELLAAWAINELAQGNEAILNKATPIFERTMIEAAMNKAGGKRQVAAKLLGWGRNTLTRKIKELKLYIEGSETSDSGL